MDDALVTRLFEETTKALSEAPSVDIRELELPLARIKRIMKLEDEVQSQLDGRKNMMVSSEAPVVFAKACELFILELTLRSWCYSEQSKRVHPASHMIRMLRDRRRTRATRRCARRRIRGGSCARTNRRKTLQKEDISAAIHKTENFDFLVDSVGRSAPPPPPQP